MVPPDKPPVLRETRIVKLDAKTVEEWLGSGIIAADDVMKPLRDANPGENLAWR